MVLYIIMYLVFLILWKLNVFCIVDTNSIEDFITMNKIFIGLSIPVVVIHGFDTVKYYYNMKLQLLNDELKAEKEEEE